MHSYIFVVLEELILILLSFSSNVWCLFLSSITGTFGQVLECWDRERIEMVAIKIVRGIKKYREAAMIEIDVLNKLGKYDKNGSW